MLREQVRWVLRSGDLEELEVSPAQPFLNPQLTHGEMANTPYSTPPASAGCC
jgi:hypothetical protein